ncbi:unnamed protein product [marine sediment metagenome]|uniref:Uncharacterized protein n=1 Tax=marine sediment metagenome TaxID=412755 RepID=X1T980_9ZZZZ
MKELRQQGGKFRNEAGLKGCNPVSGKPVVWKKPTIPWVLLLMEEPVDIGGWWYLLPNERAPPEERLDLTNLIELPDDDDRKHPNEIRKEIERHRELLSRREDYEFAS